MMPLDSEKREQPFSAANRFEYIVQHVMIPQYTIYNPSYTEDDQTCSAASDCGGWAFIHDSHPPGPHLGSNPSCAPQILAVYSITIMLYDSILM